MLDGLFQLVANTLNFFYTLWPNYTFAIAALTCVVMLITTPLTLKGTRSMIEMQRLQPQIRKIQLQYKDDRQKQNEELMAFYKQHEINPVGGCLPLLIQAPVFSILFYVVRGLTNPAKFVAVQQMTQQYDLTPPSITTPGFQPKYLDHSTNLYQSLVGQNSMPAFGNHINLADSAAEAVRVGIVHALPYLLLVAAIAGLSWVQQRQIMGRTAGSGAEINQQQQLMMRLGPLMYVFFAFISPAAIGVYFLVSTLWRVGQQAFITRSLYRGEDSPGVQAQKAMAEMRAAKKNGDAAKGGAKADKVDGASKNGADRSTAAKQDAAPSRRTPQDGDGGNGSRRSGGSRRPQDRPTAGSGASSSGARPHPRSRKKRKRK
jgi:YidC/Oxa1 family membrane protein insertase